MSSVADRPGYGTRLRSAETLLRAHRPVATKEDRWPAGPVRISAYLGAADLPPEIPGRARVLVTNGDGVLVTWDRFGHADCFPGGGIQPGETPLAAGRREVREETGWRLDPGTIGEIGWLHLESLGEPSPDDEYPYPDSFMTVFAAHPLLSEPPAADWRDTEGLIVRSAFVARKDLPPEFRRDPIARTFLGLVLET